MILDDLYSKQQLMEDDLFKKALPGYQNQDYDNSQMQKYNTRKTRLTLLQINKMRNMHDIRKKEQNKKLEVIQQQYGPGAAGGDEDMGF